MELFHHGIKGQKWGVRRYQNKDGTRTAAGRQREMYRRRTISANNTRGDVDNILSTMSKDDKEKLALDGDVYLTFEQGSSVAKRVLEKHGDTPVAFFDILDDGAEFQVSIGTRNDPEYRGRGYASKAAKKGMRWYEQNKSKFNNKPIIWGVRTDNKASIKIAESNGFKLDPTSYSDDGQWVNYIKK